MDMLAGWKYILDAYPEVCSFTLIPYICSEFCDKVDSDRAVAAGASWGGYAIKSADPFVSVESV